MNIPRATDCLTIDDIPDVVHEEVRTFIVAEITDAQGRKKHVLRTSSHMRTDSFVKSNLLSDLKKECGVMGTDEGCDGTIRVRQNSVLVTAHESRFSHHTVDEQTLHILFEKAFSNKHVTVSLFKRR